MQKLQALQSPCDSHWCMPPIALGPFEKMPEVLHRECLRRQAAWPMVRFRARLRETLERLCEPTRTRLSSATDLLRLRCPLSALRNVHRVTTSEKAQPVV